MKNSNTTKILYKGLIVLFIFYRFIYAQNNLIEKSNGFEHKRNSLYKSGITAFDSTSNFDVLHYCLDLTFPLISSDFSGTATLTFRSCTENLGKIELHAVDLKIDSVLLKEKSLPFSHRGETIQILLDKTIILNDTFCIDIIYKGSPQEKGFFFYPMCAYTMSEPQDARAWFPCHDVPWDKATAEVIVTVPKGFNVASIGLLKSRKLSQDSLWETFHWRTEYPVATYLICVTMSANYSRWSEWYVTEKSDSIEMAYYIFKRDSANAVNDFINMVEAMTFFSEKFDPYPFEKYGMAEVEPFGYGGMEHQTMTTINSNWIQGNRQYEHGLVHELAHTWWGNSVTLDEWPAIWLNEGFATYCEALFIEYKYGKTALKNKMTAFKETYINQAELNDFPIYNPTFENLFNYGIVYCKGAWILHTLRNIVGEENFWNILKTYYKTYQYRNASINEFKSLCEKISNSDLGWFFESWIYQSDYPKIKYSWNNRLFYSGDYEVSIKLEQVQTKNTFFKLPVDVLIECNGLTTDTTVLMQNPSELYTFRINNEPKEIVLDPDGWILMETEQEPWVDIEPENLPARFCLYQNFPNPFNQETTIKFDVPKSKELWDIRIIIFNALGEEIQTLIKGKEKPGQWWINWNGKDVQGQSLPSGIYVIKLLSEGFSQIRKAVIIR